MRNVAERLAVIATVTLPFTAIVSARHEPDRQLEHRLRAHTVLIVMMIAISLVLLAWTRRKGWC